MEKNGVEVVEKNGKLWLNKKHIEEGLDHANLRVITSKYLSKYRKPRQELVNCNNFQPCRNFCTKN